MSIDIRAKKLRERVVELALAVADPERGDQVFENYMTWISQLYVHYSCTNTLLILSAMPYATYVAGYQRWQNMGRQVRRGEKGTSILVPFHGVAQSINDPLTDEPMVHRPLYGFGVGYVWDISQTDGPPVSNFKIDLGNDMQSFLNAASIYATNRGIEVEYKTLLGSTNGYSEGGKIVINSSRPIGIQAQVILHELAHELMHPVDCRLPVNRALHEGEAEATAWVVLQHFGITCTMDNAAAYIRSYHVDPCKLLASLERITTTAHMLIDGLTPLLTSSTQNPSS